MSKQAIAIIVAVIILVLGVVSVMGFSRMNKAATQQPTAATSQIQTPTTEKTTTQGSLKNLLSANKNVTCQINYPEGQGSGTVFVASPNFRGDFNVKAGGSEMVSHMVQADGYAYMWTDNVAQGTKFKIETLQNFSPSPGTQSQAADLNKQVDMKCDPWSVDSSKFVVPTEVKFTDMSDFAAKMQPKGSAGSSSMPKMDKSLCDNIKDEAAKASCIKAIEGN